MPFTADPLFPGDLFDAASRFAANAVTAIDDADARHAVWRRAVEMGWTALLVDEARGGAGGSLADLSAVVEACARHAPGLPLVRRCAQAPSLLMAAGTVSADAALRALCAGEIDVDVGDGTALALLEMPGGGLRLDGTLAGLDAGLPWSHALVAAGNALLMLPRTILPDPHARYAGIDGMRCADVALDGLLLPASSLLVRGPAAIAAVGVADDLAALVTAVEMGAALGATIEHCIAHLSGWTQFGVALSTFQVLRHRVVDLYVQYESAGVLLARLVREAVSKGRLASRDASLCKLYLNEVARRAAEASIQLHGGMGMTAELPASRLVRRLLCAAFEAGDRKWHLARLAATSPDMQSAQPA
ncbi:MAG: acyl-CoA dehydrogenase family protein [Lautropia sp.]